MSSRPQPGRLIGVILLGHFSAELAPTTPLCNVYIKTYTCVCMSYMYKLDFYVFSVVLYICSFMVRCVFLRLLLHSAHLS